MKREKALRQPKSTTEEEEEKQSLCGKVYIFVNDSPAKQSYDFVLRLQEKLKLAVEKMFDLEKKTTNWNNIAYLHN